MKGWEITCAECGLEKYFSPSIAKNRVFCTKKCQDQAVRTNRPLKCLVCKTEFYVSKSQEATRNRVTCSIKCREKLRMADNKSRTRLERSIRPRKTKFKKNKKLSFRQLKVKLDTVFSKYIRTRDNWTCYTCGKWGVGGQIHCGHFISRAHMSTRYSEINCHAQCVGCNIFKAGNMGEYAYRLIKDYGQDEFNTLVMKGREIKKTTTQELEDLIKVYKYKTKELDARTD